ncbi:MAG: tetratricopeptide repeat protein [Candidatus Pacebacteria bacterium]|nr:tetratricopeptide repeat protein [Candidatus Paceibacterota bacterium]
MWDAGRQDEALDCFLQNIVKYGADRTALGMDLLLDEWIGMAKQLPPEQAEKAWQNLQALLTEARQEKQATLVLRLQRCMLYKPGINLVEKEAHRAALLNERNIPLASPMVLEFIMDEAAKQGNDSLTVQAAERIINDFPETDYAPEARMTVAQKALEKGNHETAREQLETITEQFAANRIAADALLLLGQLHMGKGEFSKADECFEDILGVREWRGPTWPATIYRRGEIAMKKGDFRTASAFFERIYLLYSNYTQWTAKAYIQRAKCLTKLREYEKVREVLEEMLAQEELAQTAEAAEAKEALERASGRLQ